MSFFSVSVSCTCTRALTTPPPPLSLPSPFPLRQHHTAASVASSVWATIFFLWRRRLSYGSFAALSSMLLNFNYCYIFHTLRVLNATCCKLHAALCCVVEATTNMWNAKWEMENCENAKCQMGNGAKAVLVSKVIKFQLIDGCVFHCGATTYPPPPH